MIEGLLDLLKEINGSDELFDQVAKCYKRGFDALIKAGFTREEAMQITARQGSMAQASKT